MKGHRSILIFLSTSLIIMFFSFTKFIPFTFKCCKKKKKFVKNWLYLYYTWRGVGEKRTVSLYYYDKIISKAVRSVKHPLNVSYINDSS